MSNEGLSRRIFEAVYGWFDERYQVTDYKNFFAKKTVPVHRHFIWYYLGGTTLFLFIVQVITGILLLFYYSPTEAAAFESVKFITTKVPFGWLIRSVHSWSANLMVLSAFIHLFSTFFLKSYRAPREMTWLTGSFLLFISMGFGFTGYLLPWNELAFFATKVGTEIAGTVPVMGEYISVILRGGEEVTGATLTRFFMFHVILLPMAIAALLGTHLMMVQLQGMSEPLSVAGKKPKRVMKFFPNFLMRDLSAWLVMFAVLLTLSVMYPWELGVKADAFAATPTGIKPEWYFVWMFETLKIIPSKVLFIDGELLGIFAFTAAGAIMVFIPFLDIWSKKGRRSWFLTVVGVLALIYIIAMTVRSYTTG